VAVIDLQQIDGAGDFDLVNAAMRGVAGVVFVLPEQPADYEATVGNVIHAMAQNTATRLVAESEAGAFARRDSRLPLARRLRFGSVEKRRLDALEAMERRIAASDLDWTIVRPTRMNGNDAVGHYRVSLSGELMTRMRPVSRADVAAVMVKALETDTYSFRAVVVSG
jgi:uncharacterized protein YbjT (DUF2867 family)